MSGGPGNPTHNGIDILCDAAGSDMVMASYYPVNPAAQPHPQQQHQHQHQHQQQQLPHQPIPSGSAAGIQPQHATALPHRQYTRPEPSAGSVKRNYDVSVQSTNSHVCHICKRVYERADHLTRHLRSHENARPYQCTRCPKRFNRADLLTRHETTHDRDGAKNRSFIRRSDRAAEACINCSSSKSKCSDEKPCTRCRSKNLVCQMPTRRGVQYRTSEVESSITPPGASPMGGVSSSTEQTYPDAAAGRPVVMPSQASDGALGNTPQVSDGAMFQPAPMATSAFPEEMMFFNPIHNPFQDMDFSWNFDFKGFTIPQKDPNETTPTSNSTSNSKGSSRGTPRDASRGHAAFKRSPWLWEPEPTDYVGRAKEGLALGDESKISDAQVFQNIGKNQMQHPRIAAPARDSLFAMVLEQHTNSKEMPTFPSLELLNYLLQAHFVQDERNADSWLHTASFDPNEATPELLGGVIATGATYISVPSIWQFGLALQEVVRIAVGLRFEGANSQTRNLMTIQAYMFYLDIGQWCGFNRQMEICECFILPMVTLLRRGGKTSCSADSAALLPDSADSADVLERKWKAFITRESYKRLVMHVFVHDTQSSAGLCKNPLLSYSELCFSLPASRDMWKAASANQWRDIYLSKGRAPLPERIPRVADIFNDLDLLEEYRDFVDVDLLYMVRLHGFWGQVHSYREVVKLYSAKGAPGGPANQLPLWIKTQHQELYQQLGGFTSRIERYQDSKPQLLMLLQLFMMTLHVSPDELQKYAGKNGEDEARRVTHAVEDVWARSVESRYAVWHAGQVLRHARHMAPTTLQGFNGIAVYHAGLTLWAYGLCSPPWSVPGANEAGNHGYGVPEPVLLDGEDCHELRAFLQLNQGMPALRDGAEGDSEKELLSDAGMVLTIACDVLRGNFPVQNEPLPPFVQSLELLLHDLASDQAGRLSRAGSEDGS